MPKIYLVLFILFGCCLHFTKAQSITIIDKEKSSIKSVASTNSTTFSIGDKYIISLSDLQGGQTEPLHIIKSDSTIPGTSSLSTIDPDYYELIRLREAHTITKGSSDVIVALIDTGIDSTKIKKINLWQNKKESLTTNDLDTDGNGLKDDIHGANVIELDGNYHDDNGHGTFMAQIILGDNMTHIGIAPEVKIMPIKAFDLFGEATTFNLARAIVYATDNGANIINMSFGDVINSRVMNLALDYAHQKGVILISSAGNVGGPFTRYPAANPNVIAVTWAQNNGNIHPVASYGPHVTLAAPGSNIVINGISQSGSSISAAIVSGTAALWVSHFNNVNPAYFAPTVAISANDIEWDGWDQVSGGGLLDMYQTLKTVKVMNVFLDAPHRIDNILHLTGMVSGKEVYRWRIGMGDDIRERINITWNPWNYNRLGGNKETLFMAPINELNEVETFMLEVETTQSEIYQRRYFNINDTDEIAITEIGFYKGFDDGHSILGITATTNKTTELMGSIQANDIILSQKSELIGNYHFIQFNNISDGQYQATVQAKSTDVNITETLNQTISISPISNLKNLIALQKELGEISRLFHINNLPVWLQDHLFAHIPPTSSEIQLFNTTTNTFISLGQNGFPRSVYSDDPDNVVSILIQNGMQWSIVDYNRVTQNAILRFKSSEQSMWAAAFADTDNDGNIEVWGYNDSNWLVFEKNGNDYIQMASLNNSTESTAITGGNEFRTPEAAVGDIDNDNRPDVIVSDFDSDLIIMGSDGNDNFMIKYVYENANYGSSLGLQVVNNQGDNLIYQLMHTYPFMKDDRTREPRYAILNKYKYQNLSLTKIDSLIIKDADFTLFKSFVDETNQLLYITVSPHLYQFSLDADTLFRYHKMIFSSASFQNGQLYLTTPINSLYTIPSQPDLDADIKMHWVSKSNLKSELIIKSNIETDSIHYELLTNQGTLLADTSLSNSDFYQIEYDYMPEALKIEGKIYIGNQIIDLYFFITLQPYLKLKDMQLLDDQHIGVESENILSHSFGLNTNIELVDIQTNRSIDLNSVELITPTFLILGLNEEIDSRSQFLLRNIRGVNYSYSNPSKIYEIKSGKKGFFISSGRLSENQIVLEFNRLIDLDLSSQFTYGIEPNVIVNGTEFLANQLIFNTESSLLLNRGKPITITVNDLYSDLGEKIEEPDNALSIITLTDKLKQPLIYPNPWKVNSGLNLTFADIPKNVELRILTIDGYPIQSIKVSTNQGGIEWNGVLKDGSKISSGVYLLLLKQGDRIIGPYKFAVIQ